MSAAGWVEFDVAWFAKREEEESDKVRIEMIVLFVRLKHDLVCYRGVMT